MRDQTVLLFLITREAIGNKRCYAIGRWASRCELVREALGDRELRLPVRAFDLVERVSTVSAFIGMPSESYDWSEQLSGERCDYTTSLPVKRFVQSNTGGGALSSTADGGTISPISLGG